MFWSPIILPNNNPVNNAPAGKLAFSLAPILDVATTLEFSESISIKNKFSSYSSLSWFLLLSSNATKDPVVAGYTPIGLEYIIGVAEL